MKSHWTNSLKLRYQKIAHDFVSLVKTKSLKISREVKGKLELKCDFIHAFASIVHKVRSPKFELTDIPEMLRLWSLLLRDGTFELGVLGDLDPAISSQLGSGNYFGGFDVKITACSFHNFKRFENTTTCVSWNSEKKNRVNVFLSVSRAG